ncbi:MAG: right-handed parallel beta-helix repeat-containing protein [Paludibacter sp.]
MKTSLRSIYLSINCLLVSVSLAAQLPAFPGAEGFGRYTTGGRGGTVYFVTNTTDVNTGNSTTHEGSLRWCLGQTASPKIILFKVGGTIMLTSNLSISKGNVSILGQSAPGDGICVGGFPITISANNVIVRYLRFRMGQEYITSADGADVLGSRGYANIIVDHCSMSWSTDECVSIYGTENTTLQWCIIAESLRLAKHSKGPHGYGGIWGGKNASFHHNLIANNDSRTPRFGSATTTQGVDTTDMRNNVIYNWGGVGCYGGEAMKVNIVNNYYKPGLATATGNNRSRICAIDKKTALPTTDGFYPINDVWGKFYIDGNFVDGSTSSTADKIICANATDDNWTYGVYNQIATSYGISEAEKVALKATLPFPTGTITTHSAQTAYEKVLAYVGCCLHRDSHDTRILNETATGTAAFKGLSKYNGLGTVTYPAGTVIGIETLTVSTTINWKSTSYPKWGIIDTELDIKPDNAAADWTPWPTLVSASAPTDTDADGMPDSWETANGLNPNSNADAQLTTVDGVYPNIEVYLNSIVANITANQNKDGLTANQFPTLEASDLKISYIDSLGKINVSAREKIKVLKIYSNNGKLILTSNTNSVSIQPFASGVYLVTALLTSGQQSSAKFIKP